MRALYSRRPHTTIDISRIAHLAFRQKEFILATNKPSNFNRITTPVMITPHEATKLLKRSMLVRIEVNSALLVAGSISPLLYVCSTSTQ